MKIKSDGEEQKDSSPIQRILQWPGIIVGMISSFLILVVFGLIIYAIFQRYVLNTPLKWGDEMVGYLLVSLVMAGAAEAMRRGDHIAIDLVSSRLKDLPLVLAKLFGYFSVIAFASILGISAYETVLFSYNFGSYSNGYLEAPMWIPQLTILVGSILLGLVVLGQIVGLLAEVLKK